MAPMKAGIVGFSGSGKTTIFTALTGIAGQPGQRKDAVLGMIKVPDERIDFLVRINNPKKTTYAEICFVDIAGAALEQTESGLATHVVNEMRPVDAIVHVVRGFDNPALTRAPDPLRDMQNFESEMILTDLIQVENRLQRLIKEGNKGQERTLIESIKTHLEDNKPLRQKELSEQELGLLTGFKFLSLKPCIVLVSQPDDAVNAETDAKLVAEAQKNDLHVLSMAGRVEAEIAELDAEEQKEFLADLGLESSARNRFVKMAYRELGLISFLTQGPDDCHAWTIKRGTNARAAAGKIHSDIERGFIRAEVIGFEDFQKHGSEAACRDAGVFRVEGKDYEVKDGDVINFRFNV
ncbi:MAG: hypothetical protein A2289_05455 [Deltaproteobacteria bacterium RIFOXYA12_FULL_58_15]|nr:MAG: hypothetical protein A2289_05455 [Deltaproteobacteria bacterium RIFOXYA12_FULL_58_15]OGR09599.1 MAG: hypothetical protein A2341_16425 [Deltaproteobacteria bacterium RIFOXYB12_FULL_58_9]